MVPIQEAYFGVCYVSKSLDLNFSNRKRLQNEPSATINPALLMEDGSQTPHETNDVTMSLETLTVVDDRFPSPPCEPIEVPLSPAPSLYSREPSPSGFPSTLFEVGPKESPAPKRKRGRPRKTPIVVRAARSPGTPDEEAPAGIDVHMDSSSSFDIVATSLTASTPTVKSSPRLRQRHSPRPHPYNFPAEDSDGDYEDRPSAPKRRRTLRKGTRRSRDTKCPDCHRWFTREADMLRHKVKHYAPGISTILECSCGVCGKLLSRKDARMRHESSCTNSQHGH